MTLDELAPAIHKSRATLSKYERGEISIDIDTLYELANLVRDDPQVVLLHDLCNTAQLVFRPHPAGGVLRIAPEHQLAGRVCTLLLEVLKIHLKGAVRVLLERKKQSAHACVLGSMEEAAIGRSVHQDLFILRAERLSELVQCRDDAGAEAQLLFRKAPVIVIFSPLAEGIIAVVREHARITENAAIQTLTHRIHDLRSNGKLHISDPHMLKTAFSCAGKRKSAGQHPDHPGRDAEGCPADEPDQRREFTRLLFA